MLVIYTQFQAFLVGATHCDSCICDDQPSLRPPQQSNRPKVAHLFSYVRLKHRTIQTIHLASIMPTSYFQTSPGEANCRLCGNWAAMTFEHIPPKSAFNDSRVVIKPVDQLIRLPTSEYENVKGHASQGGVGGYSLCGPCNNFIGTKYGQSYVKLANSVAYRLTIHRHRADFKTIVNVNLSDYHPIRLFKQILAMTFSINPPGYLQDHEELARFILNHRSNELPQAYKVMLYASRTNNTRLSAQFVALRADSHVVLFSEIYSWPIGCVVMYESEALRDDMFDMTWFSAFDFYEKRDMVLTLPILSTKSPMPGQYA